MLDLGSTASFKVGRSFKKAGKKKEHKAKLLGPVGWGSSMCEGVGGAKEFGMSIETQETKVFGGICRDFGWGIPKSLRNMS